MKIIQVPEEMRVRARQVLYLKDAVDHVIQQLTKEIVKNHFEVKALWKDVQAEAVKQGIYEKDITFDYVTETFIVKGD